MRFDMVHFIHSIYYVDMEQTLIHCFEKELSEKGVFVCLFEGQDLIYWVTLKQNSQWHGRNEHNIKPRFIKFITPSKRNTFVIRSLYLVAKFNLLLWRVLSYNTRTLRAIAAS